MAIAHVTAGTPATAAAQNTFIDAFNAVIGAWTTPTHVDANYSGNAAMTWAVTSGDVTANSYLVIGKTVIWSISVVGTTVGGTPNNQLQIVIPGGFTAAKTVDMTFRYNDAGTEGIGFIQLTAGSTLAAFFKAALANWSASADATHVLGTLIFEVQ